jgi:IcmF-related N-terminal domain
MNFFYYYNYFISFPPWLRWVVIGLAIVGLLALWIVLSPVVALIVLGGLLAVLLLVGLFLFLVKRARAKKAAAFGGELRGQSGTTPNQIVDPARRARLEELALSFEKGLEKFKAVGKDLYEMPWYVIVGEPGAGKTEAIRHSNVGFPPGMQDEFQGVGGTINMNWWFTNQAVILDTAGRLLFEEVEAGQTGEWRVFLEMLHKHRVNCPINGLLLAIPAESLIKDTPEQISKKAGKIAQQLEQIQRQLDVRFPAYVVITKCDLLNGFREFFDDMTEPQAQQQMMGWSNPDPLDAPFRPELVDDHIYTVVERLRRRRQGLLLDPVARAQDRRADEVDRLYALPHSVSLVAANLQKYLHMIFIAGAWSARPLFLRGIYFTSSLREGSALDQELAQALALSVDALPEGRAWERDRSYFLRDVFVEKAFREQGLVTRATDTKKLVLRRRISLLGFGVAGVLALLAFSWLGYSSLQHSIGTQSGFWARAADGWTGNTWMPVVQGDIGSGYRYLGDQPVGPGESSNSRLHFRGGQLSIAEFHGQLQDLSTQPLHVPFVFRPLTHFGVGIDRDRKKAQRIVFEDSAIAPLLEAARQRMIVGSPAPRVGSAEAVTEGEALVGLVRLEAGIVNRREFKGAGSFTGDKLLPPLFNYTSGPKFDAPLSRTLDLTYQESNGWPPLYLSGGFNLTENSAIRQGLERFIKDAQWAAQSRSDVLPLIQKLIDEVTKYGKVEDDLAAVASTPGQVEKTDRAIFEGFTQLVASKQAVDIALNEAKKAGVFEGGPVSLAAAYERVFRDLRLRYDLGRSLKSEAEAILQVGALKKTVTSLAGESKDHVIFQEILDKLQGVMSELEAKFKPALSEAEVARLRTLDELYLADQKTNALQYEMRWALYDECVNKASPAITFASSQELVGQEWKPLTDIIAKVAQIRASVQGYNGLLHEKAVSICRYALDRAVRAHSDEFCRVYLIKAKDKLRPELRFPLVWAPSEVDHVAKEGDIIAAAQLIDRIKRDLDSPTFGTIKSGNLQPLQDFRRKLALLDPIRDALLTPEKHLRLCTIVLLSRADQFRLSGQSVAMDTFKAIELRVGTISHATPVKLGAIGPVPSNMPAEAELGKFTMYEPFHFHFLSSAAARTPPLVDMPAPTDWTSIRLPWERQAQRIEDGRRWQFALQPRPGMRLWFEFRFDAPLPEFDDWPTRTSVGFSADYGK